jgi:hypothetical protein
VDRKTPHLPTAYSRRDLLFRTAGGFGGLALASLLAQGEAVAAGPTNPLAPKQPHFPGRAKSVIMLYMVGGPSQVETFDPKPELDRLDGKQLPAGFAPIKRQFIGPGTPLIGPFPTPGHLRR